jgi:hypothetical protein
MRRKPTALGDAARDRPGIAKAVATPIAPVTAWEAWQRRGVK